MRFYVYALVDPTDGNRPFYIGKGLDIRLQHHFRESETIENAANTKQVIGCDTKSVVEEAELANDKTTKDRDRLKVIHRLKAQGYDHTHIGRIVARYLDESTALAIEACLIKHVYGIENLTNKVGGEHSERFRTVNQWQHIPGFDVNWRGKTLIADSRHSAFGAFYVYALLDPMSLAVFYVGKGTGKRVEDHFKRAQSVKTDDQSGERLSEIRQLMAAGFMPGDICRMVARVAEEKHALAIEALLVKFVHGLSNLSNIQPGHHSGYFRAKGDWEKRVGFDLPFVVEPGVRQDRNDLLDLMIGEGLDVPLQIIKLQFPELPFDTPKIRDSRDLAIETDVAGSHGGGARIKVFIRRARIQVELRHRNKKQRKWIVDHFTKLGAYPLRRKDDVFFPDAWWGPSKMTKDVNEAIRRVKLMLEIVRAENKQQLTQEARLLLTRTIKTQNAESAENKTASC